MGPMTLHAPSRSIIAVLAALLLLSACNGTIEFGDGIRGSGELTTTQFDVDEFDSIEVGNAFEAFITVGEQQSVEVLANADLVEELDVRVRNSTLLVGLRDGVSLRSGTLEATITVPDLVALDVSGASDVSLFGSSGSEQHFEISGASDLTATGVRGVLELEVSGSSNVEMQGRASEVTIDATGASDVLLDLAGVERAKVDLTGASSVEFDSVDSVTGSLSGASDLTVPAGADVNVESSGSSDVERS